MKLAVCLSGHMRKFQETFPSLQANLLNRYDCDVFIHTWDRMGYGSAYKIDSTLDTTNHYLTKIKELYKPKQIMVEDSLFIEDLKQQGNQYAPHLMREPKHVGHMASMFYKIYACNELRKLHEMQTGTQYDFVIRSRTDLVFNALIQMPLDKSPGKAYLPRSQCSPGWLNDQFAIATPNDMDLYSSFFFHMDEYFRARNEFYPEKFMDWSMKKKNLHPEMWDLHFHILR